MKKQIVIASVLTLIIQPNLTLKAQAQSETAPCKNLPSCVLTGTVMIGGAIYYVIKNTVTGVVQRIPAKRIPPSHSNEQHEEKVFPDMGNKTCQQLADEETLKTGKNWRVKKWGIVPYTGPLWHPDEKVKFFCIITTETSEQGDK